MVAVNVGVTTSTVCLVMDILARTSLTSASCDMLCTRLQRFRSAKATTFEGRCRLVHDGETTAAFAHVSVSTCAISVVDLGTACAG